MPPGRDSRSKVDGDLRLHVAEEVFRAGQRIKKVRRQTKDGQRAAADSFDRSADSHDRAASSYERLAAQPNGRHDEYLKHATRHREYAREDRRMAQQLRLLAESAVMAGSRQPRGKV